MRSLFSKDPTGHLIFVAMMSCKRFEILISCLRFNDPSTRDQRKKEDKAAAISDLFNLLISNGKRFFCPKSNVTVDEMLVPFWGECPFKQYMPKKPAKYGLKIFCLAIWAVPISVMPLYTQVKTVMVQGSPEMSKSYKKVLRLLSD